MAKTRAKRSFRSNPREDRNYANSQQTNRRGGKRNFNESNIIEFPNTQQKKHVEIIPRNLNQENLMVALEDDSKSIVFATGPAGSGKTLLCMLYAIKQLRLGAVNKIIITRPNIAVDDNDIGYLPGDILEKMAPWMRPFTDILMDYYPKSQIENMMKEEVIEVMPIAYSRGRTFKNAIVILDESQGTTQNSLLSVLTRIGENCKILVTGDVDQTDRGSNNGLEDFIDRFTKNGCEGIEVIKFNSGDIQRHPIISKILDLYKKSR